MLLNSIPTLINNSNKFHFYRCNTSNNHSSDITRIQRSSSRNLVVDRYSPIQSSIITTSTTLLATNQYYNNKMSHHNDQQKTRIILTVKVPEISLTKKILFDQVESIKDAVLLIVEKLPPGCIENLHEYNIYIPQKSKWCKLDTPFTKYQFKENQEIEFKRDTRGGVSLILNSVGQILKSNRTVHIQLPEIVPVGLSQSLNRSGSIVGGESVETTPRFNISQSSTPRYMSQSSTPILNGSGSIRTSADNGSVGNSNSGSLRTSSDNTMFSSSSSNIASSTAPTATPSITIQRPSIPTLNLSGLTPPASNTPIISGSLSSTTGSTGTPLSQSPRAPLEHKKSFLQIIGLSPRNSPRTAPVNNLITPPLTTPRSIGTYSRFENSTRISMDADEHTTIKELLHRIYQQYYNHIDRDLLDDYNLQVASDGGWLSDRNKTIGEYQINHLTELNFRRQYQKVKIFFLNREVVLSLTPTDTIATITNKFKQQYLPSLMKMHRSPTIIGGISKSSHRQSLTLEPIQESDINNNNNNLSTISSSSQPNSPHLQDSSSKTRSHRSYSDSSPLSFSGKNINPVNSTEHSIDTIKRKNTNPINNLNITSSQSLQPSSNTQNPELAEFKDFKFFLCTKHSNPNIQNRFDYQLDEDRTLESYNFWNGVKLHFKNSVNIHSSNSSLQHTPRLNSNCKFPFFITIEAPSQQLSMSHVLEIESSYHVSDLLHQYSQIIKQNLILSKQFNDSLDEYGIYIDTSEEGKEGIEYGQSILLSNERLLSSYPIDPLDKLIFKRTNSIFSMTPRLLEQTLDANTSLTVPNILVQLKQKLKSIDGFMQEGIFRHSAPEIAIHTITKLLERGELVNPSLYPVANSAIDPSAIDAHAIAAFIKHWYMKLPIKVCTPLDDIEMLRNAILTEENAVQAVNESLPEPNRSLLLWLVSLLSDVAHNAAHNKMNAKNLAVVMSSILLPHSQHHLLQPQSAGGDQFQPPQRQLERHQLVTLLLQHLIKNSLREKGYIPLSSSTISFSTTTSTSFISTNGSASPITSALMSRSPSLTDISEDTV